MQSITVQSHIGKDGILRLQVPDEFRDVDVQVTLALEESYKNGSTKSQEIIADKPMTIDELETQAQSNGWPAGFFRQTAGAWLGEPLERPEQGEFEKRDELL